MSRVALQRLVTILFSVLILGFLVILIRGATFTVQAPTASLINKGTPLLEMKSGMRYWLHHYSERQIKAKHALDEWVIEAESGCVLSLPMCRLSAETERQGVWLMYSQSAPPTLSVGTPWYGGYINPANGIVYDLFGRAYKENSGVVPGSMVSVTVIKGW